MAFSSSAVTVTTSATLLATADANGAAVAVYNNGANPVFVGASDVTTAAGFPVAAGASFTADLSDGGTAVYGIVAAATEEVRVVKVG